MSEPLIVLPGPPPEDDPQESFEKMEEDVQQNVSDAEVGAPILPCEKPMIELWTVDAKIDPLKTTPGKIDLPTGKSNQGTLDETGYLKIEDFEVLESDMENTMAVVVENEDGSHEVQIVKYEEPEEEEPEEEVEEDISEEPDYYLKPPFDL